jgi:hypothetical protein
MERAPVPYRWSVAVRVHQRVLARYVATVLLSAFVDICRGAAELRTTSSHTTTSSTSTISTTRVPPSLPLHHALERYNI